MIGGYKIIDFMGFNLNKSEIQTPVTYKIEKIYKEIYNTDKPVLIINLSLDGYELTPLYISLFKYDDKMVSSVNMYFSIDNEMITLYLSITPDDVITIYAETVE